MKRKRRTFTAAFKSKVALEALREEKPIAAIASRHRIHPNQVSSWKRKAIEGMSETFSAGPERRRDHLTGSTCAPPTRSSRPLPPSS